MADTNTTNLNLTKPEVGGASDTWGTKINTNLDTLDGLFDSGPVLKVAKGGTGASTASGARTNLGLGALAVKSAVDTGDITDAAVTTAKLGGDITAAGKALLDDANAAAQRTTLGLGSLATLNTVGASQIDANSVDGTKIALGSDAQGDIMYYDGTNWVRLAAGTAGQLLQTNGAAANPAWVTASGLTIRTPVAMSGLSSTDFTGIPSTARRITVLFQGVSFSASSTDIYVRLGTSGGLVSSGYVGASGRFTGTSTLSYSGGASSSYFSLVSTAASSVCSGRFTLVHIGDNIWVCDALMGISGGSASDTGTATAGGHVTLSGTLDRLRVSTFTGTYDAGSVTIMYE